MSCGSGVRTRTIECRDAVGSISKDCDPAERPHTEQECKTNIPCPICKFYKLHSHAPASLLFQPGTGSALESCCSISHVHGSKRNDLDSISRRREIHWPKRENFPSDGEEMTQPLMQPYPPPPMTAKLIDQPIPSESTWVILEKNW